MTGKAHAFAWPDMSAEGLKKGFTFFLVGTMPLGITLGSIGALATFVVLRFRNAGDARRRDRVRFVNRTVREVPVVRPRVRPVEAAARPDLRHLGAEDLGSGVAVDLGCGHGIALALAASEMPRSPSGGLRPESRSGLPPDAWRWPAPTPTSCGRRAALRTAACRSDPDSRCAAIPQRRGATRLAGTVLRGAGAGWEFHFPRARSEPRHPFHAQLGFRSRHLRSSDEPECGL